MSDAQLLNYWLVGLGVAVVIVVIVAALLIAVAETARRTLALANTALRVAEKIAHNVQPIWALQTTNSVMADMAGTTRQIEGQMVAVADSLKGGA